MENTITVAELKTLLTKHADVQLIDVRETYEHENYNIGGVNIPLKTLLDKIELFSPEKITVVYCQAGGRSNIACQQLIAHGFNQVLNLLGGMNEWRASV
jgi:sulfur-carrier protein adenylyltransferase/sulfurtransferase